MKTTRETAMGKIMIEENGGFIVALEFMKASDADYPQSTPLIDKAFLELDEYFRGDRQKFTVPLKPAGTEFQRKVWTQLLKIPYGKTASYKDIAIRAGNSRAVRAVGMANNKNPIAIMIPCHRVIGSNGKLVGYAGGLDLKEKLLALEQKTLV